MRVHTIPRPKNTKGYTAPQRPILLGAALLAYVYLELHTAMVAKVLVNQGLIQIAGHNSLLYAVFPLADEVFQLGLRAGDLLVYICFQYQKDSRRGQCYPNCVTMGKTVGMSRKTVEKHISALVDKGLIQAENTSVRRKDAYFASYIRLISPTCNPGNLVFNVPHSLA